MSILFLGEGTYVSILLFRVTDESILLWGKGGPMCPFFFGGSCVHENDDILSIVQIYVCVCLFACVVMEGGFAQAMICCA